MFGAIEGEEAIGFPLPTSQNNVNVSLCLLIIFSFSPYFVVKSINTRIFVIELSVKYLLFQ